MIRQRDLEREKFEKALNEQIERKLREAKGSEAATKSLEVFERLYKRSPPQRKSPN